mgnify:CR=1 FL=1
MVLLKITIDIYQMLLQQIIFNMNYYDDINPNELASSTSFDFFILGLVIGAVLIAYLLRNNTN